MITKAPFKPKPWKMITSSYTAVAGDRLILEPQSSTTVITTDSSPSMGDEITVIRIGAIMTIQFDLQGKKLNGVVPSNVSYTVGKVDTLLYTGSTIGWVSLNGFIV
jgi:hypothetical protein